MTEKNKPPVKVSELLDPCPDCGIKPELWEEEFFGSPIPKYKVKCPKCGRTTVQHMWAKWVIAAWNRGDAKKSTRNEDHMDNDGLIELMGEVVAQAARDYQWYASKPYPTRLDKRYAADLEEFIEENPYALPYDSDYILENMRKDAAQKRAEKTRKKHVS